MDKSISAMYKRLQKNLTSEELLPSLWDKCKVYLSKLGVEINHLKISMRNKLYGALCDSRHKTGETIQGNPLAIGLSKFSY